MRDKPQYECRLSKINKVTRLDNEEIMVTYIVHCSGVSRADAVLQRADGCFKDADQACTSRLMMGAVWRSGRGKRVSAQRLVGRFFQISLAFLPVFCFSVCEYHQSVFLERGSKINNRVAQYEARRVKGMSPRGRKQVLKCTEGL